MTDELKDHYTGATAALEHAHGLITDVLETSLHISTAERTTLTIAAALVKSVTTTRNRELDYGRRK